MKKLISVILAVLVIASAVTVGFTVFATEDTPNPSSSDLNASSSDVNASSSDDNASSDVSTSESSTSENATSESATSESNPDTPTTPTEETVYTPAAVKGLSASDVKSTTLSLSWKKSKYATKYVIDRVVETNNGTVGTTYNTRASVKGTSFKETGLKAGRIYKYKVTAYRVKNGVTTKGTPASIVVMTVPEKLSKLKVTTKTDDSITLGWNKITFASKYLIYSSAEKAKGGYTNYKLIATVKKNTTTSYTHNNLDSARIYKYKVVVNRTKSGISKESGAKATKAMTKIMIPANLANKKATASSITLGWSKVKRAKGYEIFRKPAGSGSFTKIATTKKTSYKDTSVSSGANYTYKVRAYRKAIGKTRYSGFAKVSSSTAVTGVKGVTVKSYLKRALFTWSPVPSAAGYDVFMKSGNSYKYKATATYPRYLSGKLKAGKVYSFAIKSYKLVGGEKIYGTSKNVKVRINGKAYGKSPKGTWVEVCTETQTLYMYVKNKLYLSTPVVTGNYGALATTPGYHYVTSRQSPSRLRGSYGGSSWDVTVSYWLGFTADGQGIHDSTWRGGYGGEIYKGDGSHGCVNTPYNKVAKIYAKGFIGMPVIVY